MNFTRDPIIETVITPRDGCKLVVRSSKGGSQEDYFVDAVEVVSFGHSFFFRSLERPKSFLVPVSDYEILELKETRMVLKNAVSDKSIKIGGGKEPSRTARESDESGEESAQEESSSEKASEKKRSRRSRRRRSPTSESKTEPSIKQSAQEEETGKVEKSALSEEQPAVEEDIAPSFISKLFPPPPTLIKETISRYKTTEEGVMIEDTPEMPEGVFNHPISQENPLPPETLDQPIVDADQPPLGESEEEREE